MLACPYSIPARLSCVVHARLINVFFVLNVCKGLVLFVSNVSYKRTAYYALSRRDNTQIHLFVCNNIND